MKLHHMIDHKKYALAAVGAGVAISLSVGCTPPPNPIPLVSSPATAAEAGLQEFFPGTATGTPLAAETLSDHPFLNVGRNGLHHTAYQNDVTNDAGPTGTGTFSKLSTEIHPILTACPSILFTADGNIVTNCFELGGNTITYLIDGNTLETITSVTMPLKKNITGDSDASGGGYLHINNQGQLIIGPFDKTIRTYNIVGNTLSLADTIDLDSVLYSGPYGTGDNLTDITPDHDGNMWLTTSSGIIGYVEVGGAIFTRDLGAQLQNGVAVDSTGVYITTYEELHKVTFNDTGVATGDDPDNTGINVVWSATYANTKGETSGLIGGTGTTPTLFGTADNFVAITDNAPQMMVNIYDRADGTLLCQTPAFELNLSATENSPVGYGNSLALINNHGWPGFLGDPTTITPGYEKFTISADAGSTSGYSCSKDWSKQYSGSSVPIMSTATGLIYLAEMQEGTGGEYGFYATAIDWDTGDRVFSQWVGNGANYDPALMNAVIAPDGSFVYGTRKGLVKLTEN